MNRLVVRLPNIHRHESKKQITIMLHNSQGKLTLKAI